MDRNYKNKFFWTLWNNSNFEYIKTLYYVNINVKINIHQAIINCPSVYIDMQCNLSYTDMQCKHVFIRV